MVPANPELRSSHGWGGSEPNETAPDRGSPEPQQPRWEERVNKSVRSRGGGRAAALESRGPWSAPDCVAFGYFGVRIQTAAPTGRRPAAPLRQQIFPNLSRRKHYEISKNPFDVSSRRHFRAWHSGGLFCGHQRSDRKSTRLNSSHGGISRMPSSA